MLAMSLEISTSVCYTIKCHVDKKFVFKSNIVSIGSSIKYRPLAVHAEATKVLTT